MVEDLELWIPKYRWQAKSKLLKNVRVWTKCPQPLINASKAASNGAGNVRYCAEIIHPMETAERPSAIDKVSEKSNLATTIYLIIVQLNNNK